MRWPVGSVPLALLCAACTSIAVDVRTFDGTRWRISAIDDRPTPAADEYRIAFQAGRISGRFGCNGWSGRYRVTNETVTADQIVATRMACSEPAATFERDGLLVVGRPMRLTWTRGTKLTLSNDAGTLVLERR